MDQRLKVIAQLLSETGSAHGDYEMTALGGAYDEQWPDWYSRHLVDQGLNDLLGRDTPFSVDELSQALREADVAFKADRVAMAASSWPRYYAQRFLTLSDISVTNKVMS